MSIAHVDVEVEIDLDKFSDRDLVEHIAENPHLIKRAQERIALKAMDGNTATCNAPALDPADVADAFRALDGIAKQEAIDRIKLECRFANIAL